MSAGRLGGQSVAIAVESTYGSPDAADHALVDTSGLTFNAVKPTRASSSNEATTATIPLYTEPAVSTSGAGQVPEPEAPYLSSGEPAIRELGDFDMVFKGESAQGVNFSSTRLAELLGSSLGLVSKTGGTAVTVTTAVSTTVFEVSAGDIALLNPGDVVAWVSAARLTEYAVVTAVDLALNRATVRPAFSTVPAVSDAVKICSVAYPKIGALGATSLAVRYRDRAREVMSTGCRANQIGLAFAGDDRRTLEMSFTLNPAFKSVTAYGAALAAPANMGNGVALKRWGQAIYADATTGARNVATLRDMSATITVGLDPVGSATTSIIGAADHEVTSAQVSVSLTFSDFVRATLRDMIRLGETNTWVFPIEGGELAGACLIIPAGFVSELPGDTIEDERSFSTCTIQAASSPFTGTSGTPTAANGAYFLLAFCS